MTSNAPLVNDIAILLPQLHATILLKNMLPATHNLLAYHILILFNRLLLIRCIIYSWVSQDSFILEYHWVAHPTPQRSRQDALLQHMGPEQDTSTQSWTKNVPWIDRWCTCDPSFNQSLNAANCLWSSLFLAHVVNCPLTSVCHPEGHLQLTNGCSFPLYTGR